MPPNRKDKYLLTASMAGFLAFPRIPAQAQTATIPEADNLTAIVVTGTHDPNITARQSSSPVTVNRLSLYRKNSCPQHKCGC